MEHCGSAKSMVASSWFPTMSHGLLRAALEVDPVLLRYQFAKGLKFNQQL